MNRFLLIALLFTIWIFLLTGVGFSQDNENIWTVESEGTGLVTNDDVARARDNAISDALRNAVEQAVAKLITGQTPNRNSHTIRDGIYAKSDQYIRDYRINSERQVQNVYVVDVRSAVFIESIRDDLQSLGLLKVEKNKVQATEVTITVKGLTSCADYAKVKELLKTKVKGVRNVYQRELTWGTARLNLDVQGSVQSFSDELTKSGHFSPIIVAEHNYLDVTFLK
jgi:hypothetical protein